MLSTLPVIQPQVVQRTPSIHKYRPEIDGLRTVAVFLVVIFHAWPKWLPSGFIGVDIFFVISGFLITSIIIDDLERGSFSIWTFYSRRARRIFPALLLVMSATLLAGWYVLMPGEFAQLGKHVASGTAFVSNFTSWQESGYFDSESATKPLLHLWSLGVEEQFYFAWPLMVWLGFRMRQYFLRAAVLVFVLSFGYCVYATFHSPTEAYFSPITRFWELMVGGVCAYLTQYHAQMTARWHGVMSLCGVALLTAGVLFMTEQTPFPGWWALAPVFGSAMLILSGPNAWVNRRLLSQPWVVALGQFSYPFYLWHWPLLSFAYILYGERPPPSMKVVLVVGALALAVLTYRLIELPVKQIVSRRKLITSVCLLMAIVGVVGLCAATGRLPQRMQNNGGARYLDALNDSHFPTDAMKSHRHGVATFQRIDGTGVGTTVFVGDSVVEQYGAYASNFLKLHPGSRRSVIFATQGGCPPIIRAVRLPRVKFFKCTATVEAAHALGLSEGIDTVVVGGAWYGYFNAVHTDIEMGGHTFPAQEAQSLAYESIKLSLQAFAKAGKRVFLILPPPAGDELDPRSMFEGSRFSEIRPKANPAQFDAQAFNQKHAVARARLLAMARAAGAIVIDPLDTLCPSGLCPVVDAAGEPIYTDTVHMRPGFSLKAAAYLAPTLLSNL